MRPAVTTCPARGLHERVGESDLEVARALKAVYDAEKTRDPVRASRAAASLAALATTTFEPTVAALSDWTSGMAALQVDGQTERALGLLDRAVLRFNDLGDVHSGAATQVCRLHALALMGRYEEAFECGQHARAVFLAENDVLAAGKIEQNLGNICMRRDRYQQAEELYRAARARFVAVADAPQLAQLDNGLGLALAAQHEFRGAALFYEQARERAEAGGLAVLQGMTEQNLGCLALFQGRYERALDYLDRARRRFADLAMRTELASAEQDLADAYLELNLAPEAARIAERVAQRYLPPKETPSARPSPHSSKRSCSGLKAIMPRQRRPPRRPRHHSRWPARGADCCCRAGCAPTPREPWVSTRPLRAC
jgi:tetratricopeptide (TPR) repeat protein